MATKKTVYEAAVEGRDRLGYVKTVQVYPVATTIAEGIRRARRAGRALVRGATVVRIDRLGKAV